MPVVRFALLDDFVAATREPNGLDMIYEALVAKSTRAEVLSETFSRKFLIEMEMASTSLHQASFPLPLRTSPITFTPSLPSLTFFGYSPRIPLLSLNSSKFKGKFPPSSNSPGLQFAANSVSTSGATLVSIDAEKAEELSSSGSPGDGEDRMVSVCDKLMEVFLVDKPAPTDWRRLLAFSAEWESIRPHFFTRCQECADAEPNPGMKHKLLSLARKLKEIDEDVQRHNELIGVIRKARLEEISKVVAKRRKDFPKEFFVHLYTVAQSYHDNPKEQNALVKLGNECVAAVQAHDSATESIEALNAAELKFQDIINSPSLDAVCRKILCREWGNSHSHSSYRSLPRRNSDSSFPTHYYYYPQILKPKSVGASEADPMSSSSLVVDWDWIILQLQLCSTKKEAKRVHAVLFKCLMDSGLHVYNNLISVYLKLRGLCEARKVFDQMPERNVVTWTAMINGYVNVGLDDEALRLLGESVEDGVVGNNKMFVCVLNLCTRRLDFELGKQIHACIVKGNWSNLIVDSTVVYFYAQCGDLKSAFCAFDLMVDRDVVCWTGLITACSQQGHGKEALVLFLQMLEEEFLPNEFTVCAVLKACSEEKELKFGRQLHGAVVKKVYKEDVFVGSCLVDMYGKCGQILDSRRVFNGMRNRNTVTWTSIIAGYARKGLGEEAVSLFRVMNRRKIMSNNLTIVSVLRACGSIGALLTAEEVHAQIVKNLIQSNGYLETTLVWLYCKCGKSHIASKILQKMPLRDAVSWTAIISGYAGLGHESEALEYLKKMVEEGIKPNSFTCSSALKACASLESVVQGKLIHSFASKIPASSNVFVGSALIHMYAKCGYLSEAIQVFDNMPKRNLVSWRAMILGYARNGLCREALQLIYRMQAEGIEVDDYVLATVLTACGDIEWDSDPSSDACNLVNLTSALNYNR